MEKRKFNIAVFVCMTLLTAFVMLAIELKQGFFNVYGYVAIACGAVLTGIVLYELFKPGEEVGTKDVVNAPTV